MSQSTKRDYYEVLGIGRDADEAAIKKAFRRLARELHPDVNPDDPTAEERFKEAAEAHEVLSDPDRRRVYDQHGHEGLRGGGYQPGFEGFGSFSDLFSAFFGGGGSSRRGGGPMEGEDVAVQLAVSLEEAARGAEKTVTFEQVVTCERCHGNQAEPGTPIESCQRCNGQGQLQAVQRTPFGQVVRTVLCDVCDGEGKTPKTPCTQCQGRGRLVDETELTVDVPAGIADGQRMRLAGRGHAGERGGPAGDLYVLLRVRSDPRFVRDGDDLVTALDVPAPLAALGSTLDVETLLDGRVPVEVPAGTQPGEVLKLQGQGMPSLRGGRRGDLRVVANVTVPKRLTPEQRELLERFAASLTESNAHDRGEGVVGKLRRLLHRD